MIELKNVNKSFGKNKAQAGILDNFNLKIESGDTFLIYGKSGIGKSTLLNIMGGLMKPDAGEVLIDGKNIYELKNTELIDFRAKHIGFVFQMFHLIPQFTVLDNIIIGMHKLANNYSEKKLKAYKILKDLNLEGKAQTYPDYLSGGEQQRIAIARAIANDSRIILADEPTGNLDEETTEEILSLFKSLNNQGKTIIIVSHDEKVKKVGNKILYLQKEKE